MKKDSCRTAQTITSPHAALGPCSPSARAASHLMSPGQCLLCGRDQRLSSRGPGLERESKDLSPGPAPHTAHPPPGRGGEENTEQWENGRHAKQIRLPGGKHDVRAEPRKSGRPAGPAQDARPVSWVNGVCPEQICHHSSPQYLRQRQTGSFQI